MSNALAAMYRTYIQDFLDGEISSGKLIELIPGLDDSKYQKMFNELAEGDVARIEADKVRIKQLETCLTKIDEIRNSIVGYHQINWSAHIYPLVAALEEAGYEGIGYEEASKLAHTQLDRIKELEADRDQWRHKFNMLQHDFTENQRIHNSERNIDSAERDRLQERVRELEGFNRDMNAIIQRDIRTLEQQRITALEAELAEAKALSTHAHEMWDRSNRRREELFDKLEAVREDKNSLLEALHWIANVNSTLDLNKLEHKVLVGLIHELRGKAKALYTKSLTGE